MDELRKCVKCRSVQPLIDFGILKRDSRKGKKGDWKQECRKCEDPDRNRRLQQSKPDDMAHVPGASLLPVISTASLFTKLGQFRPSERNRQSAWDIELRVNVSDTLAEQLEDQPESMGKVRANALAMQIFEETGIRFMSVNYDCSILYYIEQVY